MRTTIDRLRGHHDDADGFTFVEVLVVVLIIGVLATLAIPSFFAVRDRGWHAASKSDVRNMTKHHTTAQAEGNFVLTVADLVAAGFDRTEDVQHGICGDEGLGLFAVAASHESHDAVWIIDFQGRLVQSSEDTVAEALEKVCGGRPVSVG